MPSYLRSRHGMNTRIYLSGAAALYRQWRRMNPRQLRNSALQGTDYVVEVLNEMAGDTRLRQLTGLSRELFDRFVEKVTHTEIVREGPMVTIQESCVIFLAIMHLRLSNRQAQERFQHSGATITAAFRAVLIAVNSVRGTYITGEAWHGVMAVMQWHCVTTVKQWHGVMFVKQWHGAMAVMQWHGVMAVMQWHGAMAVKQ